MWMISSKRAIQWVRLEFWPGPLTLRKKVLNGKEVTTSERAGMANKNGECHCPWLQSFTSHLKAGQSWPKLPGSFLHIWLNHLISLKWNSFTSQVSVSTWWPPIGNVLLSLMPHPSLWPWKSVRQWRSTLGTENAYGPFLLTLKTLEGRTDLLR